MSSSDAFFVQYSRGWLLVHSIKPVIDAVIGGLYGLLVGGFIGALIEQVSVPDLYGSILRFFSGISLYNNNHINTDDDDDDDDDDSSVSSNNSSSSSNSHNNNTEAPSLDLYGSILRLISGINVFSNINNHIDSDDDEEEEDDDDDSSLGSNNSNSSSSNDNNTEGPSVVDDLICPIELQLPFDPVMAEDGRVYERAAIEDYIKSKEGMVLTSPITRKRMGAKLIRSPQTRNIIETLITTNVITGELADNWKERCKNHLKMKELDDLIKKAEDSPGDPELMYKVGLYYYRYGWLYKWDGFPGRDGKSALEWFEKAHNAGHIRSTFLMAIMLLTRSGPNFNAQAGSMYLGIAAAMGDDRATYMLGDALADGKFGLPVSREGAIMWLKKAAATGSVREELAKKKLDELLHQSQEVPPPPQVLPSPQAAHRPLQPRQVSVQPRQVSILGPTIRLVPPSPQAAHRPLLQPPRQVSILGPTIRLPLPQAARRRVTTVSTSSDDSSSS